MDWSSWAEGGDKQQTTIYESLHTDIRNGAVDMIIDDGTRARMIDGAAGTRACMRLSLLIKKQNHRKHNSHQWFMKAFASELEATYVSCTDCATTFHPQMLNKLVNNLEHNPATAAVCGRQRVMPVQVQTRGQAPDGAHA